MTTLKVENLKNLDNKIKILVKKAHRKGFGVDIDEIHSLHELFLENPECEYESDLIKSINNLEEKLLKFYNQCEEKPIIKFEFEEALEFIENDKDKLNQMILAENDSEIFSKNCKILSNILSKEFKQNVIIY